MKIEPSDLSQIKEYLGLIKFTMWLVGGLGSMVAGMAVWVFRTRSEIDFLKEENKSRKEENEATQKQIKEEGKATQKRITEIDENLKKELKTLNEDINTKLASINTNVAVLSALFPRIEKAIENNKGGN